MTHINNLCRAFARYQNASQQAPSVIRKPLGWKKEIQKAQEVFRAEIGELADHIDWSDSDD